MTKKGNEEILAAAPIILGKRGLGLLCRLMWPLIIIGGNPGDKEITVLGMKCLLFGH